MLTNKKVVRSKMEFKMESETESEMDSEMEFEMENEIETNICLSYRIILLEEKHESILIYLRYLKKNVSDYNIAKYLFQLNKLFNCDNIDKYKKKYSKLCKLSYKFTEKQNAMISKLLSLKNQRDKVMKSCSD